MKPAVTRLALIALAAATGLSACNKPSAPTEPKAAAAAPAPVQISAPAGNYAMDPNHSSLSFTVNHLGLSNYIARFTKFDATIKLDPANLAASSVTASIDPASVRTDFPGDYKAGHADSPYASWDEDLAKSPKFFNAAEHSSISFTSTSVSETAPGKLQIVGDLSFLGQTHPVTLQASVVGSAASHPFSKLGALGFSATGTFNRSGFGMTHLNKPGFIGDAVTIHFEGEFQQQAEPPTTPAG